MVDVTHVPEDPDPHALGQWLPDAKLDRPNLYRPTDAASDRVLLVINRKARNGDINLVRITEALSGSGLRSSLVDLDEAGDLDQRLTELLADGDVSCVVAAGGDGTINAVLPAVLAAGVPLGIIPLGTANDLARTLGIPTDPTEAARVVLEGRKRRIDVGTVNGRPFLNAAGIGFSTDLLDVPAVVKGFLGILVYPATVVKRWRRRQPFRAYVRGDDGIARSHRVVQVTVANGRHYGGGMTAHEHARIDDGLLELLLIRRKPLWHMLWGLLSLRRGVYSADSPVVRLQGPAFEVVTRRRRPIAADGELSAFTPARFEVLPRALEVHVTGEATDGPAQG